MIIHIYVDLLPKQNNSRGQPKTHPVTLATQKTEVIQKNLKYGSSKDVS